MNPRVVLLCAALVLVGAFGAWSAFGPGESDDVLFVGSDDSGAAWLPFNAQARKTYSLSDDFAWTPYRSGDVRSYEIRFGDIGPKVCDRPVCSLKEVDGLHVGVPYRVSVVACCTDGRRVAGASGIFVFR